MAKARTITCIYCKEKQPIDDTFTQLTVGKSTRYVHNKCLNKYNEKKEKDKQDKDFRSKEYGLLDKLVEVVGEIHELPKPTNMAYQLPRNWYHIIQDWRNGSQRYTHNFKRKYKKGLSYEVIIEAYKLSKDSIRWAKMEGRIRDTQHEIRYGLVVVNSKLSEAIKKMQRDQHMEKVDKMREEEEIQNMEHERETVFKKQQKASYDISELFD